MTTAELFVKSLENEGVEYLFGVPGEENLDLLEALRTSSIKFILTRHEQAAAFMAANYGRFTGKPGVVLSTLGPGATNLTTGVAYAYLGGMPMIVITGQKSLKSRLQGDFQIIDVVGMMKTITKQAVKIETPKLTAAIIRNAFKIASAEKPGPVHIELPEDLADDEVEGQPIEISSIRRPSADAKSINLAAEMIQNAKSPLILLGADANRYRVSESLKNFVGQTGIPFMTTQQGKNVLDNRMDQFIGTSVLSTRDYIHCAIDKADLIINVGHNLVEKPPFLMSKNGPKVIHINHYEANIGEVYFPNLEVVGDISNSIEMILKQLGSGNKWDFEYFMRLKNIIAKRNQIDADSEIFPMHPQRIVSDMNSHLSDDAIVCLDNGMYKLWFARGFVSKNLHSLLLDNTLGTMGAGLPSAIIAKIVYPERDVIAVCGDGGFMMNSQELETAVRLGLDLTVVVLNDGAYGMIKWKQNAMKHTEYALDYGNPDFVKYAESYGAKGFRVESVNELGKLLRECEKIKGVKVIDLPIDYSDNIKVFTEDLENISCNI